MQQFDFSNGNIFKQFFLFSTPIILANLLQVSYQFVDSLWVGNLLGAGALGAVTISATVISTALAFILGISNAALTILSQQRALSGAGLKRYLNAFVVLLFGLSLAAGAAGFIWAEPVVRVLGTPSFMIDDAASYLRISFAGILFLFGYNFISTVLRALGNSRTPLLFVFIAAVLNIVLDPIFIAVFNWGINGAAFATVVSQGVAFVWGLFYMHRLQTIPLSIPFLPKKEEIALILKLGIPSGLQMVVIFAGITAIMTVVNSFGSHAIAGFGAAQRIDSLIILPALALGTAVTSMAGQNIAQGNWARVGQIARYGALYNFAVMLLIAGLVFVFAEWSIKLFIEDKAAIRFGTSYLQTIAFFYPFIGLNFILNGVVRSAGAMYQILVLNTISFWVLRYPLTYFTSYWTGETGIALGMGISFIISSLFALGYYRFGKWKTIKLFASKNKKPREGGKV